MRCNGNADCDDGSDERDCRKLLTVNLVKLYCAANQSFSLYGSSTWIMLVIIVYMSSHQLSGSTLCLQ